MRLALAALALALLTGCSALRFAYDNADTYLRWRAGSYLDVHGEDSEELDERIQAFMAWHRAQALPKYVRIAEDSAQRLSRGLSRPDLVWGYDAVTGQVKESLYAAAERIAPMLDRLTPEQVAHLEERFGEDNRRFAREFLRGTEEERRQRRTRRTVERMEDWVGRLTQPQLERIQRYSAAAPLLDHFRDHDRRRLQAEFLSAVRAREAKKRLPQRAADWQQGRDAQYVAANDAWQRELFALALDLDRMLTPEQRARAVAQMRRYAQDLRVLAARPATGARTQ